MGSVTDRGDEWLEAAFAEVRESERDEAPSFRNLLEGRSGPAGMASPARGRTGWRLPSPPSGFGAERRRRLMVAGVAVAAGIAAVIATITSREITRSRQFEESLERATREAQLGSWTAPSDFLLDVPGRALYASLPRITTDWRDVMGASSDTLPPEGTGGGRP